MKIKRLYLFGAFLLLACVQPLDASRPAGMRHALLLPADAEPAHSPHSCLTICLCAGIALGWSLLGLRAGFSLKRPNGKSGMPEQPPLPTASAPIRVGIPLDRAPFN